MEIQIPPKLFISCAIEFQFPPNLISPPSSLFHFLPNRSNLSLSPNPKPTSPKGFAMKGGRSRSETKNTKLAVNKKGASAAKGGKKLAKKAAKDPNKPKRPASAFFVFMEEFRQQYKEKHPNNKAVSVVGKAGGEKWKSLSAAEKAPYVQKADARKVEYEKNVKAYNKKQAEGTKADDEEESEKSISEVNDEDDEEDGSGEDEDDE